MKKNVIQLTIALLFLGATTALKAQATITEYFAMKSGFYLDVKDKRVQKMVSAKGLLDIYWDDDKRTLSISYLVGKIDKLDGVLEALKKVAATPLQQSVNEVKVPPVTPF